MNVLVVGGSGFVGSHLVPELVDRDHDVTVLSREPDTADLPEAVETVVGDVTAYDSIEGAFEGQDAVIYLVALSPLFKAKGGGEMHDRIHRGGTENCLRAAEEHGVDRFVQLSGIFADPDGNTAYLRAKGAAEELVRDSALDWVIFRPTVIFGDGDEFSDFVTLLTTPVVTGLPGGGKVRYQPIYIGDLVPMIAEAIEDDDHVGHTYEIGGPEELTLAEITRLVYRSRGSKTRVLPIPTILAKVGLKALDPVPFFPLGADQARSMDVDLVAAENEVTAFDVDPADMRTYAEYLGVE